MCTWYMCVTILIVFFVSNLGSQNVYMHIFNFIIVQLNIIEPYIFKDVAHDLDDGHRPHNQWLHQPELPVVQEKRNGNRKR